MGVKDMLEAGVKNEENQMENEKLNSVEKSESNKKNKDESILEKKSTVNEKSVIKKNHRPTNESLGLKTRKQYTLTLIPEDYKLFLEKAREEGRSFAVFMERAAFEYLKNHE